ncbi:MAG: hypothetical protein EOP83_25655 [Verrucomicrobiaceae bacterium]|nr:MAG: hypothetical protein EOP83_25655 [Verrucomicrobiaceae bacterium]
MARALWQLAVEDYAKVRECIVTRSPELNPALDERKTAFVVFTKKNYDEVSEITEWLEETGTLYRRVEAGSFVFFEFETENDAVAFKLRWY